MGAGQFNITGHIYDTKPTSSGKLIKYDREVDTKEWKQIAGVKNLGEAEKWLLENHPDYYMGAVIQEDIPNGRRMVVPRPGSRFYSEGEYETIQGRRDHAKWVCDYLGYTMGPAEYGVDKQKNRPLIDAPSSIKSVYEAQMGS